MPKFDAYQLDQLLKNAGFADGQPRQTAWAVAMRETRGDSDAVNKTNANGSWDYGLFQINNKAHKNDVDWSKIFDANYQANLVYNWTSGGSDWSTWGLGKEKGWAKQLWENNRPAWEQINRDFQEQYDLYSSMVADAAPNNVVVFSKLKYGVTAGSVKKYQKALRRYLTKKQKQTLNPAGATGYFGKETVAMTQKAYKRLANKTGSNLWLKGDLTKPSKELCLAIGLTVI